LIDLPSPWFYSYRILQGQQPHLVTISDATVTLRGWIRVIYEDGTEQLLTVPEIPRDGSERQIERLPSLEIATQDGWVVGASVEMLTSGIKRGQTYVRLKLEPFGVLLLADYCYSTFGQVALGTFIQPGPGGGGGHLHVITVKALGAPTSGTFTLPLSNMVRKVLSFAWPYIASVDVASRTLNVYFNDYLSTYPVMTSRDSDVWLSGTLTLTASEGGVQFADSDRSGNNDNGTMAIDSDPTPFPIWVSDDQDTDESLQFVVANEEVLDVDAIYVFVEEWITP